MKPFFSVDESFENPFFIGTVEDNQDPTFNYRVRVRIPILHPETITKDQLPWAAKLNNSFMGIGDEQSILHSIPEVGSQVLVLAVGNNVNSLVYLGCLYKKTPQTPADEEKYVNNYGIYTKNGEFIGVEKIENLLHMVWNGEISIETAKNITVKAQNIDLNADGNVTICTGASEAAVLGDKLKSYINDTIVMTFNSHTHVCSAPGVASGTPSTPITAQETFLSKNIKVK